MLRRKIFNFTAERIGLSKVAIQSQTRLASDARNLPRALFEMQAQRDAWEEFNNCVNRVLPNVKRVVVTNQEGQTDLEVELWPVDPSTRRDDLIVHLADSGTGVSQVLAILCAAMTFDQATIAIDEPGNFLHPGAIKALVGILKQFPHQYVVTTHSLEAIVSAAPAHTYLVEWENCVSNVRAANLYNVEEHRATLAELGVSISDVFGMDRVVWVEGETEELCFPIVVQATLGFMPSTAVILRVRSVDEVARKHANKDGLIWDLYKRLASVGGLVTASMRFLFDRESRTEKAMDDAIRESAGLISFIPRRTFENYLLQPELLAEQLGEERAKLNAEADVSQIWVEQWLAQNAEKFSPKGASKGGVLDAEWKRDVNAPALLDALFKEALQAPYQKTQHSPALTRRLVARGGSDWEELKAIVMASLD